MQYKKFQDIQLSCLGMGNMRLPGKGTDKNAIDYDKAQEIIDYAMASGINYYDTAYVYNAGESERFLGVAMKKFPRDSYYLATKFHIGSNPDYKAVFAEQLDRLQTDHIDFYLCHCITDGNVDQYLESGCIQYFQELKQQGKIRYLGFSSHASPETLARYADAADWDFAQIQLNYYDFAYGTTAKEYEVLASRNIPIMVMEPVRGGRLADLTEKPNAILKAVRPEWSIASWALRFVKTKPAVQVVLSGMSDMAQIMDNANTFSDDASLTEAEQKTLAEALDAFRIQIQVPCTACRYCCDGCPMQIEIPAYMKLYNAFKVEGRWGLQDADKIESTGKPADCIGCGSCMGHCPQNIDIPSIMKTLAAELEKLAK